MKANEEEKVNNLSSYDNNVFLCFKSSDIDNPTTFIQHFSDAFRKKGFNLLIDDVGDHEEDEEVPLSCLKLLLQSKRSIVIFSENFAASTYCLDQLCHIIECKKAMKQLVSPIFYGVLPINRHWRNLYNTRNDFHDKAMAVHEERFGKESKKVRKWSSALYVVGGIDEDESRYPFPWLSLSKRLHGDNNYNHELQHIQHIVERVTKPASPQYDVFISFCGEDTRYSFTGFLYHALCDDRIKTFMDDEGLVSGNEISKNLLEAIESSKLAIVVLSENYAYSTWCLDELVKIIECMKMKNQLVLPVFYKVEQLEVKNQTRNYGDAMMAHENRFGKDYEKVEKWKSALSQVASLKGEHVTEDKYEYEFETIKEIVQMVYKDVKNRS